MVKPFVRGIGVAALVCGAGIFGTHAVPQPSHAAGRAADSLQTATVFVLPGPVAKAAGYKGADGKFHDSFVPSTLVVKAGQPLKVTVYNYDDGMHSITSPSLGLNVIIAGGKESKPESASVESKEFKLNLGEKVDPGVTTFTLSIKKAGTYYWYCALPCDGQNAHWAMNAGPGGKGQVGTMGGYIVVV
jgi:uncharacterized cupredoxin-like copper-binding protein